MYLNSVKVNALYYQCNVAHTNTHTHTYQSVTFRNTCVCKCFVIIIVQCRFLECVSLQTIHQLTVTIHSVDGATFGFAELNWLISISFVKCSITLWPLINICTRVHTKFAVGLSVDVGPAVVALHDCNRIFIRGN